MLKKIHKSVGDNLMVASIIEKAKKEVDMNYEFFKTKISEIKSDHLNEFALLHHKKISNFFISEDDAIQIGIEKYGEGNFSIQQVNDNFIDLGYQSFAII